MCHAGQGIILPLTQPLIFFKLYNNLVNNFTKQVERLHFDNIIIRFIKSGIGGTYKPLRRHPPSPQLVNLTSPFPNGEGFFLLFYLLSFKKIVCQFLMKVDGYMSRVNRDKCPEQLWILSSTFIEQLKSKNASKEGMRENI